MAGKKKKEVPNGFAKPWQPETKGEKLEGIYLGSEHIPAGNSPEGFTSYRIRHGEGRNAITWGASGAVLAAKLLQLPVGTEVEIQYLGKMKTSNGAARDYKVLVDDSVGFIDPLEVQGRGEVDVPADADIPF